MKKKVRLKYNIKKFLCFFLIIIIIVITNGTFAKYISGTNGTASVKVAKFSFSLKNGDNILADNFVYDLAANITENANISQGGLCPGKAGEIDLTIDMTGTEVETNYAIYMNPKQTIPDNLRFYSDSSYTTEVNLGASSMINGTINLSDINTPLTKKIYWKWIWDETINESSFEGNDFLFDIKVVVRQVTSG